MTGMCINTVMQCIYVQTKTKPISQRNNHPEEHRIHPIREGLLHEAQPHTHTDQCSNKFPIEIHSWLSQGLLKDGCHNNRVTICKHIMIFHHRREYFSGVQGQEERADDFLAQDDCRPQIAIEQPFRASGRCGSDRPDAAPTNIPSTCERKWTFLIGMPPGNCDVYLMHLHKASMIDSFRSWGVL